MTRQLTPDIKLSNRWRLRWEFKLADAWIGAYWADFGYSWDIWICMLPCLPLHFYRIER